MGEPAKAAVVLLYRDGPDGLQVFWARRAHTLSFLGGFWAFSGGRLEDSDRGDLIAAAARELEEETGVRIPPDPAVYVEAGRTVTPDWASIRFDATYYLVEAPSGSEPQVRGGEHTEGEWVRPADALAAWRRGERLTSPVVVWALRALEGGLAGAAERMRDFFAAEAWGSRLWDLVPGVALAPVRTPTLPPATHTNCYVVGGRELIVIDPASPYPEEQAALDRALDALAAEGRRVREIWLTHHHVDHVSGAAHLAARTGAPVAAHPATAERVAGRVTVSRAIADGDREVLPGVGEVPERRLRAIFTPGHAPGHLCFLEETTGYLITGDMVAGIGTIIIDPDEGSMRAYLASLARMKAEAPRVLLPAHGPVLADPQAKLDEYVQHRLWREARVADALAARGRATAGELVADVYQDVPPALFALAERSLLAHLVKLVEDGRARAEDGRFTIDSRGGA